MPDILSIADDFDPSFKIYYDLMKRKVSEILLVSSLYDAFIMEEDEPLTERIIHEYRGLNLSRPPRLTWVANAHQAFGALSRKKFDLVITIPRQDDMDPSVFGSKIKEKHKDTLVVLLTHAISSAQIERYSETPGIDRIFVWSGSTYLLLAIIKNLEDCMNADSDTKRAMVRVIILVEDSPVYRSSILPLLYQEIVGQTKAVMEDSLNEEHRIVRMRARPKILVAETFEDAESLYRQYKPYLLSVFSDVRFPRDGKTNPDAGYSLLSMIREESPDLPLLMFSAEEKNHQKAMDIPAVFLNKNSVTLHHEIHSFLTRYLGFGDFIFRFPDGQGEGREVARAANLLDMEKILPTIPEESVLYHATRNHFSTWLMARSEIVLALKLKPVKTSDFSRTKDIRDFLSACIRERRKRRQRGIIADFSPDHFDIEADFIKVGRGSLGGKARGLAFMSALLRREKKLIETFPDISIFIPKTLVLSTEGFDEFVDGNCLKDLITCECHDNHISELFLNAHFPERFRRDLESFLKQVNTPLAVRSSSLLEDSPFQPWAGVYHTYMIPNNHADLSVRLAQLIHAIKLVYASTFMEIPKTFAKRTMHRTEEEKMAVIIQQLIGDLHGDYFYPGISGVAQSYNFYPISYMKPEDGIVHLALGLGKTVVEGESSLRFSPAYPQFLPQFSTVDDILKHSQQYFYALRLRSASDHLSPADNITLARLSVEAAQDHFPVKTLSGTYIYEEHRIRDGSTGNGHRVLTFANILKYNLFPLPHIVSDILEIGKNAMGCPVEIEFAVNLFPSRRRAEFALLQIRPMMLSPQNIEVEISDEDIRSAICYSDSALGNGCFEDMADIVFVKPDEFDPGQTVEIAAQIKSINHQLEKENRKYLLIGPGRWGTADRWLGIPVNWSDISGVGAIIEAAIDKLNPDPSQGSHFFNNITSMGIAYLTVRDKGKSFTDWSWLMSLPPHTETAYVRHIRLETPLMLKADGKHSRAVVLISKLKMNPSSPY